MLSESSKLLDNARQKLYSYSGGSIDSGDVRLARITTEQLTAFYRSQEYRDWVAGEKAEGREVFHLRDIDKTLSSGDSFTKLFDYRAKNNKFTLDQLATVEAFLLQNKIPLPASSQLGPSAVINAWQNKSLALADFWLGIYYQSMLGMTEPEVDALMQEFAPHFASSVYPGISDELQAITDAGAHAVLVSNGDQKLAEAFAPPMKVKPENVIGSFLNFEDGPDGRATGFKHTYEIFTGPSTEWPQVGKVLNFHYWLHLNKDRFGWKFIDDRRYVIADRAGDSASADGGMWILLPPPALGNYMIDTPGEPGRIIKSQALAEKYGYTPGQYFTVTRHPAPIDSTP